jgi:hypothetical protein
VGRARVAVAAAVGTFAVVVAVGTFAVVVAVGTFAAVGVAPLDVQAATIASTPPMTTALAILNRAAGCPIIWTPPVGRRAEP